jgi:hypothetical protein
MMPRYYAPEVYIEEVDTGDKTINGESNNTTGMAIMTKDLAYVLCGFIQNRGKKCYIVGIAPTGLHYTTSTGKNMAG